MKYNKIILIILALFFIQESVNSHGPSRQKVSESIEIQATPEEVWKIVSDFTNFKWNKNITELSAPDRTVGSERILKFKSGQSIIQKLEKLDEEKKMISWRITETNNDILPVNSYGAKIFIKAADNKTLVQYKTGFYRGFMGNDPPEELNDENSKIKVTKFIEGNLKGLKRIAEGN